MSLSRVGNLFKTDSSETVALIRLVDKDYGMHFLGKVKGLGRGCNLSVQKVPDPIHQHFQSIWSKVAELGIKKKHSPENTQEPLPVKADRYGKINQLSDSVGSRFIFMHKNVPGQSTGCQVRNSGQFVMSTIGEFYRPSDWWQISRARWNSCLGTVIFHRGQQGPLQILACFYS